MDYKSATTADSKSGMRMITRSAVDENTALFSGLTDKTRAKAIVALSGDIAGSSQSEACAGEEGQTVINEDNGQETNGQHPVSSKQQVGEPLFESSEFDDTAELNIDDTAVTTINNIFVNELFPEHSSSISYENDVMLDKASYPETIEGCIQVIVELRQAAEALHLIDIANEHFLGCLQSDALEVPNIFLIENREREH